MLILSSFSQIFTSSKIDNFIHAVQQDSPQLRSRFYHVKCPEKWQHYQQGVLARIVEAMINLLIALFLLSTPLGVFARILMFLGGSMTFLFFI